MGLAEGGAPVASHPPKLMGAALSRDLSGPRRPYQVVLGLGHVWVVGPAEGLVDAQGSSIVLLHLLELALVLAEQGQVVELLGHVGVVRTQDLRTVDGVTSH